MPHDVRRVEGRNKRITIMNKLSTMAGAIAFAALSVTLGQPQRPPTTREFMRDKLELSQRILEGVALEDYDLIVTKATRLSAMSKEARWQAFQNPDYERYSVEFRRSVDALAKAARDKNLDGATLGYVRVTMSCVECHKFVRGQLVASLH